MDLIIDQFDSIFGRTVVERYSIVGHSYDHCFMERA